MILVVSVFIMICGCLVFSPGLDQIPTQDLKYPQWGAILKAYGIIAFLFDLHPSVLTILVDMEDKKQLPTAIWSGYGGKYL